MERGTGAVMHYGSGRETRDLVEAYPIVAYEYHYK